MKKITFVAQFLYHFQNFKIFFETVFGKPFPSRCQKWFKIWIFMQKWWRKLRVDISVKIQHLDEKMTKNIILKSIFIPFIKLKAFYMVVLPPMEHLQHKMSLTKDPSMMMLHTLLFYILAYQPFFWPKAAKIFIKVILTHNFTN